MANSKRSRQQTDLLLTVIDQAFDHRSWHGTNLRGALQGLTATQVAWRPQPERHCIAEHALHTAYWKYTVRRRLCSEKRGSFPLKGSDWFPLPQPWDQNSWRSWIGILKSEHDALRQAVTELNDNHLTAAPAGSKVDNLTLLTGIAAHDLYHTGQIQLIKRLMAKE
ncbi:MAG: DinB family protein [Planctomycetota bacterium]